ncbi:MAG TPA: hypothetical protein VGL05_19645 [Kribbella sp.]
MSDLDPISDGPIEVPPQGFVPDRDQLIVLMSELRSAGVELGAYDERIARWVAGWDWMTVATIASWIRRAAAEAPVGPVVPDSYHCEHRDLGVDDYGATRCNHCGQVF